MQAKKLITTMTLSKKTGLPMRVIHELVRDNRIPVIRLRKKRLLFDEAAVEEAIRRAEVPAIAV
jgi:excisionase family DNA binding protein